MARNLNVPELNLKDLLISLRTSLVDEGRHPKELDELKDTLKKGKNKFDKANQTNAGWLEQLSDIPDMALSRKRADIVYFRDVSSYSPAALKYHRQWLVYFKKSARFSINEREE